MECLGRGLERVFSGNGWLVGGAGTIDCWGARFRDVVWCAFSWRGRWLVIGGRALWLGAVFGTCCWRVLFGRGEIGRFLVVGGVGAF